MSFEMCIMLRFVLAVFTVVPSHVFVVNGCAMLLEIAFLFGFVLAILTVVPRHIFIVD